VALGSAPLVLLLAATTAEAAGVAGTSGSIALIPMQWLYCRLSAPLGLSQPLTDPSPACTAELIRTDCNGHALLLPGTPAETKLVVRPFASIFERIHTMINTRARASCAVRIGPADYRRRRRRRSTVVTESLACCAGLERG
jgi:hypothetical protein